MILTILLTIAVANSGSSRSEKAEMQECMMDMFSFGNNTLEKKIEENGGSCIDIDFKGEPKNKHKFACRADGSSKPNACCVTRESTELESFGRKTYVKC